MQFYIEYISTIITKVFFIVSSNSYTIGQLRLCSLSLYCFILGDKYNLGKETKQQILKKQLLTFVLNLPQLRDLLNLFIIFLSSNEAFMLTNRSTDVILLSF